MSLLIVKSPVGRYNFVSTLKSIFHNGIRPNINITSPLISIFLGQFEDINFEYGFLVSSRYKIVYLVRMML